MGACYDDYKAMTESALDGFFRPEGVPYAKLLEAMRYSLLAGGKRLRPVLVLAFCASCGGKAEDALPVACAAEMLHTYSLIHDDLPCMDNDDLRRGRPTNHKVYGEATAVLAGDALQAEAFKTILSSPLPADVRAECARILADAAGENGICGGQYLDMRGEMSTLSVEEQTELCQRKTASLIAAACKMGAVVGGADSAQLQAAETYGQAIGLAFQIRDDILDESSTDEEFGKPVGSDRRAGKSTFMSLFGAQKCEDYLQRLTDKAKAAIAGNFVQSAFLIGLADELRVRKN